MTWKLKGSVLTAAVISALAASQAQAGFTYDLRVTSGPGIVDAHDVALPALGGTYVVQLWGQITGDSNLTNDGFNLGFVSLLSSKTGLGAFSTGGFASGSGTIGTHVNNTALTGANIGSGGADVNGDGIADWGTTNTTATGGWTRWGAGQSPGFVDGVADAQSEQVNANTWEVLIGTYTITTGLGVGAGTTSFTPFVPTTVKSSFTSIAGLAYFQDDAQVQPSPSANSAVDALHGITFTDAGGSVTTPEPASLGLLTLGGLALMNRRRRQA